MSKTITYQTECPDIRLTEFIMDYAESGSTVIHFAAKYSLMTGQCLEFLQQTFDQYLHKSMYQTFNESQRKEFEYLIKKYKIRRSELYANYFNKLETTS